MEQNSINSEFAKKSKEQIIKFLETYQMNYKDQGRIIDVYKGHTLFIEIKEQSIQLMNDQNQLLANGTVLDVMEALNGTLSFTV